MYRSAVRVAFWAMLCAASSVSAVAPKIDDDLPVVSDWLRFSNSSLLFWDETIDNRASLIDGSSLSPEREPTVLQGQSALFDRQPHLALTLATELSPTGILIEVMASPQDVWRQEQRRMLFEPIAFDGLMTGGL